MYFIQLLCREVPVHDMDIGRIGIYETKTFIASLFHLIQDKLMIIVTSQHTVDNCFIAQC